MFCLTFAEAVVLQCSYFSYAFFPWSPKTTLHPNPTQPIHSCLLHSLNVPPASQWRGQSNSVEDPLPASVGFQFYLQQEGLSCIKSEQHPVQTRARLWGIAEHWNPKYRPEFGPSSRLSTAWHGDLILTSYWYFMSCLKCHQAQHTHISHLPGATQHAHSRSGVPSPAAQTLPCLAQGSWPRRGGSMCPSCKCFPCHCCWASWVMAEFGGKLLPHNYTHGVSFLHSNDLGQTAWQR